MIKDSTQLERKTEISLNVYIIIGMSEEDVVNQDSSKYFQIEGE